MNHVMYQTGTINSLLDAVYTGDKTVANILQQGDFGLGTYDRVDGEMIICDGVCYRANVDGELETIDKQAKTPFALASQFHAHKKLSVKNLSFKALEAILEKQFVSPNIVYAIKVQATFKQIDLRSEACKTVQKTKLAELLPKIQHSFSHKNISGVLVCVWFPEYMANINVPGFHFHFVDDARKIGGHVFDFELKEGVAEIQEIHSVHLDLIHSKDFYQANLSEVESNALSNVEKKK